MDIVRAAAQLPVGALVGLMTIPPFFENPEDTRPISPSSRAFGIHFCRGLDPAMLRELSMGMSHDFEIAVQEGSHDCSARHGHLWETPCLIRP